ncbi:hypothetical protein ACHRVW_12925 [Flavobacterium collinsii]|nr:hypothetical protein [Flavobacterium collinsii]
MKANKTRDKEIAKLYASNKPMQNKDRIINLIVFALVLFLTVFLISQLM